MKLIILSVITLNNPHKNVKIHVLQDTWAAFYISFRVEDLDKFKSDFDNDSEARHNAGIHTEYVYCHCKIRNEVLFVFTWKERAEGVRFYESPEFKKSMFDSGVESAMLMNFGE